VIGDESGTAVNAPEIALRQIGAHRARRPGWWHIRWELQNKTSRAVELIAARLPHGKFKAPEMRFEPALELDPGRRHEFEMEVLCRELPGAVIENAFVILEARCLGQSWRIFARLRVALDRQGLPGATSESITAQKIGFSGVSG
jgi:hypothetical protein